MMKSVVKKLHSSRGESLAETLVALLIAAIALIMLASMISSTTRIVTQSKTKMKEYYDANVTVASQSGEGKKGTVTIDDEEYDVTAYLNPSFSNTPIASYRLNKTGTVQSNGENP